MSEPLTLSEEWRDWVVDNLLRGATRQQVIDALADEVPLEIARAEVECIASSPLLASCARLRRRAEQRELCLRLRREHRRFGPNEVERRARVEADEFFGRYYATATPVVLTDVARRWRAVGAWSPSHFRERFAGVEIEAMVGRDADPHCDRHFEKHRATMTMDALVDRVLEAGVSNDVYLIANNHTMKREAFRVLLDDVSPDPAIFDGEKTPRAASLWFGPAGTLTPLHHDTTNILFCQIHGRKRVVLVPPDEPGMLDEADGFYARVDPESDDWPSDRMRYIVELERGDALFIPAGWWHQLRALDVSISFSLMSFRRPNAFSWYRPGSR